MAETLEVDASSYPAVSVGEGLFKELPQDLRYLRNEWMTYEPKNALSAGQQTAPIRIYIVKQHNARVVQMHRAKLEVHVRLGNIEGITPAAEKISCVSNILYALFESVVFDINQIQIQAGNYVCGHTAQRAIPSWQKIWHYAVLILYLAAFPHT